MADFLTARFTATYRFESADGTSREQRLVRYGETLLGAPVELAWSLPYEENRLVGSPWSDPQPTGNASKTLGVNLLIAGASVAEAEARAKRLEMTLALNRTGELTLREAYHDGAPLLVTSWRALVSSVAAALCTAEEAPALVAEIDGRPAAAWARLDVEFLLTYPRTH